MTCSKLFLSSVSAVTSIHSLIQAGYFDAAAAKPRTCYSLVGVIFSRLCAGRQRRRGVRGMVEERGFKEKHVRSGKHLRPGECGPRGLWPDLRYPLLKECPGLKIWLSRHSLGPTPGSGLCSMLGYIILAPARRCSRKIWKAPVLYKRLPCLTWQGHFVFLQGKQPGDGHYC